MKKLIAILLPIAIVIGFTIVSLIVSIKESLTFDEVVNIQEGKNAWLHHTFNIELYHPPLAKDLQALPIVVAENVLHIPQNPLLEKDLSRSINILFADILLICVFFVTKKYSSTASGIFAMLLCSLEPNILAFGHIVNTDMLVTLMIFVCFVAWFNLLKNPSKNTYLLFCILLGLGLSSKMSFDSFFVLSAFILLFVIKKGKTVSWLWTNKQYILFTSFIVLIIIWTTYFFHFSVVVKERNDASRFSSRLLNFATIHHNIFLVSLITFSQTQQIPLGDYIALYKNVALAKASPTCFFKGVYYPKCYWYFMPFTFLEKSSLPFLLFTAFGFLIIFVNRKKQKNLLYFCIPPAVILLQAATSGAFPLNRYMLPVYPFLAVVGGQSFGLWKRFELKVLFIVLLAWLVMTAYWAYPHFLSFTNELSGSKKIQYKYFQDANIDWGQSLPDVKQFILSNHIHALRLSYFGRDDGNLYGLASDKPYGSVRFPEICEFHTITYGQKGKTETLMSISNWWLCGYYKQPRFSKPKGLVSDSFLLF